MTALCKMGTLAANCEAKSMARRVGGGQGAAVVLLRPASRLRTRNDGGS